MAQTYFLRVNVNYQPRWSTDLGQRSSGSIPIRSWIVSRLCRRGSAGCSWERWLVAAVPLGLQGWHRQLHSWSCCSPISTEPCWCRQWAGLLWCCSWRQVWPRLGWLPRRAERHEMSSEVGLASPLQRWISANESVCLVRYFIFLLRGELLQKGEGAIFLICFGKMDA